MRQRAALARVGEDAAVELLRQAGYEIVGRNVRLPEGEIDVVCRDGPMLVFVEVKARGGRGFGSALGAVDARKRRKLRALAADYLQIVSPGARARFDIVTLEGTHLVLHRNAFS